jgi:hypothetical protein
MTMLAPLAFTPVRPAGSAPPRTWRRTRRVARFALAATLGGIWVVLALLPLLAMLLSWWAGL